LASLVGAPKELHLSRLALVFVLGMSLGPGCLHAPRHPAEGAPVSTARPVPLTAATVSVFGRVIDSSSGRPVQGALVLVRLEAPSTERQATTDAEGQYEITRLQPGRYIVHAEASGYPDSNQRIEIARQRTLVNIFLAPRFPSTR